ncbi:MAG: mechanosensitive ion channel [Deltaproteobacteria bacterium]|nr:mechanosensitive ion channel [Deltaproteobacteria bacterium]
MPLIRSLLVVALVAFPRVAAAEAGPASLVALGGHIEVAEQAWIEAIVTQPVLVSLGAFPDWSNPDIELSSALRERLKLLDRKAFSNRQWQEHWNEQRRAVIELESLYGELASTVTGAGREAATAKQASARDWGALAKAKMSNQDAYLVSIEMERDSVKERLESLLGTVARLGKDDERGTLAVGATPFEKRAARIADLRFREASQSDARALAVLELKLIQQQVESGTALEPALQRDVELAHEEHRIAQAQLLSADPDLSGRWLAIVKAAAAKVEAIEQELDLSGERQHSIRFDLSLAESQIAYRDQKHSEMEGARQEAEAFSGWLAAVLATARQKAPRVIGVLLLILIVGRLALWIVGRATRALVNVVEDGDPDNVSAKEQRAKTIAAVLKGVAEIVVYFIGVLIALDVVGIDTAPVLGSVAILGLALSFGSQNLVRDFVNGFFIIVENQYSVGDWVKIGDHEGDVEQINIRSTRLRSVTGVLQIIPNGTITTVENMTRDWSQFRCHVGVSYDSDIDLVERICNEVGAGMYADPALKGQLMEAPTFVGVTQLGDSAVVVRSAAKTRAGAQWSLEREMNRRLKKAFEESGIEIPLPQRVVWHRDMPSE